MTIRNKIEKIIFSIGMELSDDLSDQLDSISFVTLIIEIEQEFGIEIPDDRLDFSSLSTIDAYESLVTELRDDTRNIVETRN